MRSFILGTDWGADCDDAVAIRVLARHVLKGEADAKLIGINCFGEHSYHAMKVYLDMEGVPNIPVGLDTEIFPDFPWKENYQLRLASYECKADLSNPPDAAYMYRKVLAEAQEPIEIMEVGFLGPLARLLESQPDELSSKTGVELVKEKVKRVWIMGGKWDEEGGREFNLSVHRSACKSASVVCDLCPVPITFLGWEIGHNLLTGDKLKDGDILKDIIKDWGSDCGRESWDPMLVEMAIVGSPEKAGYKTVKGYATVDSETGKNYFKKDDNGPHEYVIKSYPDTYYSDIINEIIKK